MERCSSEDILEHRGIGGRSGVPIDRDRRLEPIPMAFAAKTEAVCHPPNSAGKPVTSFTVSTLTATTRPTSFTM